MRKALVIFIFLFFSKILLAQNEIGPEGDKLIWLFLILVLIAVAVFLVSRKQGKSEKVKKPIFQRSKLKVELGKDALYYPDNPELVVKNTGSSDVDLDRPLLVFDNFWLKRKFKLKGVGNRTFYPLYLEKGKTHSLQIDLNRFYSHDKSLKKFPKAQVILFSVKGKKLGSKSVFLRKTLFKY